MFLVRCQHVSFRAVHHRTATSTDGSVLLALGGVNPPFDAGPAPPQKMGPNPPASSNPRDPRGAPQKWCLARKHPVITASISRGPTSGVNETSGVKRDELCNEMKSFMTVSQQVELTSSRLSPRLGIAPLVQRCPGHGGAWRGPPPPARRMRRSVAKPVVEPYAVRYSVPLGPGRTSARWR